MTRRISSDASLTGDDDAQSRSGCGEWMAGAYVLGMLLLAVGLAALLLHASMQVDARGVVTPGEVLGKHEYLQVRYDSWSLDRELAVRYRPPTPSRSWPHVTRLSVADEATFDRLRVGGPVRLRYFPRSEAASVLGLPSVRLADRSTIDDLRITALPMVWEVLRIAAVVVVAIAFIMMWWKTRSRVAALAAVVAVLIAFTMMEAPDRPPVPMAPVGRATAIVREVDRITRQGEGDEMQGFELLEPYQLVGLAFVPERVGDTVLAVDAVDDGSVRGLAPGVRLTVTYDLARPRAARIDGATRTFTRKNIVGLWTIGPATLAVLVGVFVLGRTLLERLRAKAESRLSRRRSADGAARGRGDRFRGSKE